MVTDMIMANANAVLITSTVKFFLLVRLVFLSNIAETSANRAIGVIILIQESKASLIPEDAGMKLMYNVVIHRKTMLGSIPYRLDRK